MRIQVCFGKTTSPNLRKAVRTAKTLPGFEQHDGDGKPTYSVDLPVDLANPAPLEALSELIGLCGSWKSTEVRVDGKLTKKYWSPLSDLRQIAQCYGEAVLKPATDDYCLGREAPSSDVGHFGCRFVQGVSAKSWGRAGPAWHLFGQLSDDLSEFSVDRKSILSELKAGTEGTVAEACPLFAWKRVSSAVDELPGKVRVGEKHPWKVRYSDLDSTRPMGIRPSNEGHGLAFRISLGSDDEGVGETSDERQVPSVRYADIAGQESALETVRELCELPLTHGEYFAAMGVEPHKGIILYGPPGNGKTLVAKAVATESDAHLETINGPEVLSKWVGESEGRLRAIFDRAGKHAPSVILIDEIDSLAPKRDDMSEQHNVRLISQLLVLLDGLEQRGRVLVIATTNRLDALDPAVRRPGRFDYHIRLPLPNQTAREKILTLKAKDLRVHGSVRFEALAAQTEGWSGAELTALVQEAGLIGVKRSIGQKISADKAAVCEIDFLNALKSITEKRAQRSV